MSLASFSEKQTSKKVLVSCAGLGMGNASRISAILEQLHKDSLANNRAISIHVVSWGAGHIFLKHYREKCGFNFELIEIKKYKTFSLINFFSTFFSNNSEIKRAIKKIEPDLLLLDSDYHFISWFFYKGPKISIAQARDVIDRISLHNYKVSNFRERITLFFREELDAFFHKIMFDKVLVPSFYPEESNQMEIKIPLIVRDEFLKENLQSSGEDSVTVLLSGSEIDKQSFIELKKYNFKIISPGEGVTSDFLTRAADLDQSEIIFTQGGLSSISEVLARKKFLVVFPINNHPEQTLNGLEIEKHNAGLKASTEELQNLDELLQKIKNINRKNDRRIFACNGAHVASGYIIKYLF